MIKSRARYYDPTTAQFLTPDPLVAITGSAYGYAANDPINGSDPSGMCFLGIFGDCPDPLAELRNAGASLSSQLSDLRARRRRLRSQALGAYGVLSNADFFGLHNGPLNCPQLATELVSSAPVTRAIHVVSAAKNAASAGEACLLNDATACGTNLVNTLAGILAGIPVLGLGPGWQAGFDTIADLAEKAKGTFNCVARVLQRGGHAVYNCHGGF